MIPVSIPESMVMMRAMVMMMMHNEVKIAENEKSWEEQPTVPEGIGNPVIEIVVIPRRRIVRDDRGPFIVIVAADGILAHILIGIGWRLSRRVFRSANRQPYA
ncbi:MAG: hypothetical protein GX422_07490 [Deltaproteobacteria bacterium]|nr:hypothetical protein [Deltaproteobacteria bacterium]